MNPQVVGFLGKALVPFIVIVSLAYFRKRFPAMARSHQMSQKMIWELDDRFRVLKWVVVLCMLGVGLLFLLITHAALVGLNQCFASAHGPSEIQLLPQTAIWWFFPGFGALSLSWEITLQLWALLGDRKSANIFSDWSNVTTTFWGSGNTGMDSRRVLRLLSLLIALPIGLLTLLALPMHAALQSTAIRDCGYAFKPCKVYPLADARRITTIEGFRTRGGKIAPRAGLVIDFKDGSRWSSAKWGNFKHAVDPTLGEFFVRKTNLPLNSAITEEDIPTVQ